LGFKPKRRQIELLIKKIKALGDTIPVISNNELNSILFDLASALTTGIKNKNDKKLDLFIKLYISSRAIIISVLFGDLTKNP
jgi:hypothetical protein